MTKGELKEKLLELYPSIINLSKDPTLGETRKMQMCAMIFLEITDEYWDDCDNDEIIK